MDDQVKELRRSINLAFWILVLLLGVSLGVVMAYLHALVPESVPRFMAVSLIVAGVMGLYEILLKDLRARKEKGNNGE